VRARGYDKNDLLKDDVQGGFAVARTDANAGMMAADEAR
jgi:hypothetical protein